MKLRDFEKRLEAIEAAVSVRRTRPPLSNRAHKPIAELRKELEDALEEADREEERVINSPEHKRLMLEPSLEGHRYRQSWFKYRNADRLIAALREEIDGDTPTVSQRERVAANKAFVERGCKREAEVEVVDSCSGLQT